ncbi:MAG TPA: outer membrane protein assembly factor BamD [Candidatus Dormibacteraeota bacterium]|nr:outer membrane protein assembly factor BamD [Candidatus Dormibacteraeota bacterium]
MRRTLIFATSLVTSGILLAGATQCNAQLLHKKKVNKSTSADNTAEPDKVLYLRALDDIKHGRQEVGRLNLQTLINTYPDSEYLAKAKLSIADSYYKEGGTANLAQAIQAYKDFIVFFPFLPEAPYAQLQVANSHYQQMQKPDRDRTEARDAEDEYQTFLQKYPNDPLGDKAQQHLRDVQEVLAEGDYRIAYYYYVKGDKRAAASRLTSITTRYPLYSKCDHALWMLGDLYETSEKRDVAVKYYAQVVRDYPMSPIVADAKYKLKAFGIPIPQPDPNALAWMTANANAPRPKIPLYKKPIDLLHTGPVSEFQTSARVGAPTMTQEGDTNTETLHAGSGPQLTTGSGPGSASGQSRSVVAVVEPGSSVGSGAATGDSHNGEHDIANTDQPAPEASTPGANGAESGSTAAVTPAPGEAVPPAADGTPASTPATDAAATTDTTTTDSTAAPADGGKTAESSSKKKKGLKKLVPW